MFARVGARDVGGAAMMEYARRLGFNRQFASDLAFAGGVIAIDPRDEWQVAEMASGYTNANTLSPLHGATLAATAVNGGRLIAPMVVEEILGPYGVPIYRRGRVAQSPVMSVHAAAALKKMMRATVTNGSARRSFAQFHRGRLQNAVVGGKTGSLTGFTPRGKYDWFVGFGELGARKIAFAALCINKEKWRVKSARLAREMLEFYFRTDTATIAANAA